MKMVIPTANPKMSPFLSYSIDSSSSDVTEWEETGKDPIAPDPKAVFILALALATLPLPGLSVPETTVDPWTIVS